MRIAQALDFLHASNTAALPSPTSRWEHHLSTRPMLCQMTLAEQLIERMPDHSLTLLYQGFSALQH